MIVLHKMSDLIREISKVEMQEVLHDMLQCRTRLERIWDDLERFNDGVLDEFDLLDTAEANRLPNLLVLKQMADCRMSVYDPLNTYFSRTVGALEAAASNLELMCDTGSAPVEDELQILKDSVFYSLAGILFMLRWEFGCEDTCNSLEKDAGNPYVDEILFCALGEQSATQTEAVRLVVSFAEKVLKDCDKFKLKLDIFDEAPEKEADFESLVGPALGEIDEQRLTMDLVDSLLAGEITVEELISQVKYSDTELTADGIQKVNAF